MAIDEQRRYEVHKSFEQLWDSERAATVMELIPPDWTQLATKTDVALSEQRMLTAIARSSRNTMGTILVMACAIIGASFQLADRLTQVIQTQSELVHTLSDLVLAVSK